MRNITYTSGPVLASVSVAFLVTACVDGSPPVGFAADAAVGFAAAVAVAAGPRDDANPGPGTAARTPVFAQTPPPPITGGTLVASRDGERLLVADPARDEAWVLALPSGAIIAHHEFEAGAEPGRAVEGDRGMFHLALRSAGDIVSLSRDGALRDRRHACAAPRGLVSVEGLVHVACAEGLLVTFAEAAGPAIQTLRLEDDLRDVVVDGETGGLAVSLFRRAEVLFLDAGGVIVDRRTPPAHVGPGGDVFAANVAWRMRAAPGGGVLLLHQRSQVSPVEVNSGTAGAGYAGAECSVGVVQAVLSHVSRGAPRPPAPALVGLLLAVDFDLRGDRAVVVAPGVLHTPRDGVVLGARHQARHLSVSEATGPGGPGACASGPSLPLGDFDAQLTAVAVLPTGEWVFQGREPAVIVRDGDLVTELPTSSIADDGHAFFHQRPGVAIACASCHPEGGDDGHIWSFEGVGARRTQSLRGPVLEGLPFHWAGEVPTFEALAHTTIEDRMGGASLHGLSVDGMARFVESIPHLPLATVENPEAVVRGAAIFASGDVGCAECHWGDRLSDDRTVDVGTGGPFQVPGLRGVRHRAPYLHDGRAATLRDVVERARLSAHGDVAHLSATDVDDLVAFLRSL